MFQSLNHGRTKLLQNIQTSPQITPQQIPCKISQSRRSTDPNCCPSASVSARQVSIFNGVSTGFPTMMDRESARNRNHNHRRKSRGFRWLRNNDSRQKLNAKGAKTLPNLLLALGAPQPDHPPKYWVERESRSRRRDCCEF